MELNHWYWFSFALALIILEIFVTGAYLLWLGIAGFVVGIILWLAPSLLWQWQLIIFAGTALVSIFLWRQYRKTHPPTISDNPQLNRRAEQYIGREFTLTEPIVNGRGKITVDDSTWKIEGEDFSTGTKVRVTAADGVILKVEKVESTE